MRERELEKERETAKERKTGRTKQGLRNFLKVEKTGLDGWQAFTSERHVGERDQERGGS